MGVASSNAAFPPFVPEPAFFRACLGCCTTNRELTAQHCDLPKSQPLHLEPAYTSHGHPFLDAVAAGDREDMRVQLLLDQSVARSASDSKGNTAAHVAAANGLLPIFQFLVGLEPELLWAKNDFQNSPAHKAAEAGMIPILSYIREKDPTLMSSKGALGASPMHLAASNGQLAVMIFLAKDDVSLLSLRDRIGSTSVHYAAIHGHIEVIKWVASRKPNLIIEPNDKGDTPAHLAAGNGQLSILRFLVEFDPSTLFMENAFGNRLIHLAPKDSECKRFLQRMESAANELDRTDTEYFSVSDPGSPRPL